MDLHGPPVTARGNEYILVIQDLFAKYVLAIPIANALAATLAHMLCSHWCNVFGPPIRVLTDNEPNFSSILMHEVLILMGSQKVNISPYRPQSNGSVERMNRTLTNMLSHFVKFQGND
jgi:transposase InsO family protein